MNLFVKFTVGLALIAAALGLWYGIDKKQFEQKIENKPQALVAGTALSPTRALSAFTLQDDKNAVFTTDNLKNHWTFLFFGFTHCHSICPTTLAELAKLYTLLPTKNELNPAQIVLVTVDPTRDTPQVLHDYLQTFNPAFIGLTGDEQTLATLRQELGILVLANNPDHNNHAIDDFDHSGTVVLIDPAGHFHAIFSMPHDPQKIAQDYLTLTKRYAG